MQKNRIVSFLVGLSSFFLVGSLMANQTIALEAGTTVAFLELNDTDAAKDFVSHLPLELNFEDYGSTERIAYLKTPLNLGRSPRQTTPVRGDFTYYAPWGNIAVFRKDFRLSEGLVPLGSLSTKALAIIENSGKNPVTFRLLTQEESKVKEKSK